MSSDSVLRFVALIHVPEHLQCCSVALGVFGFVIFQAFRRFSTINTFTVDADRDLRRAVLQVGRERASQAKVAKAQNTAPVVMSDVARFLADPSMYLPEADGPNKKNKKGNQKNKKGNQNGPQVPKKEDMDKVREYYANLLATHAVASSSSRV